MANKIIDSINLRKRCEKYRLESVWQCPEFLFLIFGIVIIGIIIASNLIVGYYGDPELAAFAIPFAVIPMLVISYSITKSFEYLALASEMKSEFISIMSHQLRSPLTSIKWQIEARLSKPDNGSDNDLIRSILKENKNALDTIKKFLELENVEKEKFLLNKKEFSLSGLIKEVADAKNKQFPNPPIAIRRENEEMIFADYEKIKFVLESIIDNALRYGSPDKKTEILMEKNGKDIKISISDNGPGISEAVAEKIFQKFVRPKDDLKYQIPGLGLGLYLSKKIIEKHSGKIGFQTKKEKGSTFWFTLPI